MKAVDENTGIFLQSHSFFKGLDKGQLQSFLETADLQEYPKGQTLFLAGDKAKRLFIIMGGWVKLYRSTMDGEVAVLALFTRGDVFGEAAIFEGATYPFSAEIAENAKLLEISDMFLRSAAQKNPEILNRVMASMSREMGKLQLENEHLAIMTAPQRVGCLLLQLSSGMLGKGGTFTFPYDKSLAAARLGMKAETFSRALSQLKPYGVNTLGSEIQISSFQCLVQYVCGHCSLHDGECRGSQDPKRKSGCGSTSCE
jgi:CRP-like cAMP-binding protein